MHRYIHLNNYSNGKEKWSYHPNILNIWISCLLGKQEGSNAKIRNESQRNQLLGKSNKLHLLSLFHSVLQTHWLIRENGINIDCLCALIAEKREVTEGSSRNITGISKHYGHLLLQEIFFYDEKVYFSRGRKFSGLTSHKWSNLLSFDISAFEFVHVEMIWLPVTWKMHSCYSWYEKQLQYLWYCWPNSIQFFKN